MDCGHGLQYVISTCTTPLGTFSGGFFLSIVFLGPLNSSPHRCFDYFLHSGGGILSLLALILECRKALAHIVRIPCEEERDRIALQSRLIDNPVESGFVVLIGHSREQIPQVDDIRSRSRFNLCTTQTLALSSV